MTRPRPTRTVRGGGDLNLLELLRVKHALRRERVRKDRAGLYDDHVDELHRRFADLSDDGRRLVAQIIAENDPDPVVRTEAAAVAEKLEQERHR